MVGLCTSSLGELSSLVFSDSVTDELPSPQSASASLSIPDLEAKHYYHGLPSRPVLVARTGADTWKPPTGYEAFPTRKELRTVGNHPLKAVWEDNLALQVLNILESKGVKWTSMDVGRIGLVTETVAPVIVWIGVKPNSLSRENGLAVAKECRQLLVASEIVDVEVEIRESVVTRYVGPKLRKPARFFDPTAELLEPLTSTLGPFICNSSTPWTEGTGGFYVTDDNSKLYLVTARHVVFEPNLTDNETYERKFPSQPRVNVSLLGTAAFKSYIERIKLAIKEEEMGVEFEEGRAKWAAEGPNGMDAEVAARLRAHAEARAQRAKKAIVAFKQLYNDVATQGWENIDNRVLGHVRFSPSIEHGAGPNRYTRDYALVEIDSSKIEAASFTGNAIDLGTEIPLYTFICLMSPNPNNRHFKYPDNRLFKVQGIIPDEEMRRPTIMDQDDPGLIVMKRGNTTGLTFGRANDILSYVRNYNDNGIPQTSKEWAIFSYDSKSGSFSDKGDSGSGIVDCFGRLGGLLTSGTGAAESSDVTYATPISFILDSLKANGYKVTLEANLGA